MVRRTGTRRPARPIAGSRGTQSHGGRPLFGGLEPADRPPPVSVRPATVPVRHDRVRPRRRRTEPGVVGLLRLVLLAGTPSDGSSGP